MRIIVTDHADVETVYEADVVDAYVQPDGSLRCVTGALGAAYESWSAAGWKKVRYVHEPEPRRRGRRV